MASPRKQQESSMVSRTYRAAIKLGDDFVTIEETIALPIDASETEIAQAVETGWRIYQAQRAAADSQIQALRESQPQPTIAIRDPDAPASEKQRNYVSALQDDLTWSDEQLVRYASDQGVDLVTMTKGQASGFIDGLKKLAEERAAYHAEPHAPTAAPERPRNTAPASERQLRALHHIAGERGLDLVAEVQRQFELAGPEELSMEQASSLLTQWQRPRNGRRQAEPAL